MMASSPIGEPNVLLGHAPGGDPTGGCFPNPVGPIRSPDARDVPRACAGSTGPGRSARSLERNVELRRSLTPHLVAAAVVEAGRLGSWVGVPCEVLDHAEVHPAIQQATHEGPPEVVRGALADPCCS